MAKRASGERYAALLRGINVGGKHVVPMAELARLFSAAGCRDVATYIQSGNVVFGADARTVARLPGELAAQIQRRFGVDAPVVLRTHAELAAVAGKNPFVSLGADLARLMVVFLAETPARTALATLDPARSPPDELVVRGRDIYLRCPNGYGRSKLTNQYFDSKLKTVSTVRNWRTVLKLVELTAT
jgi:uncharacterized protein (DUF1697 family)